MTSRRVALLLVPFVLLAACARERTDDRAAPSPEPTATPCVVEGASEETVTDDREAADVGLLSEVYTAERSCPQVGFVFENEVPPFSVGYEEPPFAECGSGERISTRGWGSSAYLVFHSDQASGVDLSGAEFRQTYEGDTDIDVGSPILRRIRRTCDFEATLEWVIAIDERHPFKVRTTEDPPSVVIDVGGSSTR